MNEIKGWPKLAWVANFMRGSNCINVSHGPYVERNVDWCVEAVWAGDFYSGDFDKTDLIFGSGIRARDGHVTFVSSGTMLDRLWYCEKKNRIFIGNTLPGLLAISGFSLIDNYPNYQADIESFTLGLNAYKSTIPAYPKDVSVIYHNNLLYDGKALEVVSKKDTTPDFTCYEDYRDFLFEVARRLGTNLKSDLRKHRVIPLGSVSSGYDSSASAVVAKKAGCKEVVSIINASSFIPRKDSGIEISSILGLACREYIHKPSAYKHETFIWSSVGMPAGLNLTIFDFPKPLCLFFTGYRGDTIWEGYTSEELSPLAAPTISGLSLCEFRLVQGLFHCPVPCWGSLKSRQIQAIGLKDEMASWRLNRQYDRPIPRRILEEAFVPRNLFGVRKEATTVDNFFLWPFTVEAMSSFDRYLKSCGVLSIPRNLVSMIRIISKLSNLIYTNIPKRFRHLFADPRKLYSMKAQALLFQWSNHELKKIYASAL